MSCVCVDYVCVCGLCVCVDVLYSPENMLMGDYLSGFSKRGLGVFTRGVIFLSKICPLHMQLV